MASKPIFDPADIVNELNINWGDGLQGISRSWDTPDLTVYLGVLDGPIIQGTDGEGDGAVPMTATEVAYAKAAFSAWSEVADLNFTYVDSPDDADISMGYSTTTKNDGTYTSNVDIDQDDLGKLEKQDIVLSADASGWPDQQSATISDTDYGLITMTHEIGHALGLTHPGEYNAGDPNLTYDNDAIFAQDNRQYTIMSYFGYEYFYVKDDVAYSGWTQDGTASSVDVSKNPATAGELIIYPSTPMVYDILAIQEKYGANMSTRAGDTTYGFGSNAGENYYDFSKYPKVVFTIWDGGGNDTLNADFTDQAWNQNINLNPGEYSSVGGLVDNIGIAFGVTIENAIGGIGADTITGNAADNHLVGNEGDDILDGGGGNDTLEGDAGNDTLSGESGEDTLLGGDGDDALYGGLDGDVLMGGNGNDILDGGGNFDSDGSVDYQPDYDTGGAGNDTFIYSTGYWQTTITDFSQDVEGNTDTLDLTKETAVHDFEDLLADASQEGTNTVFKFSDHDVLTLENFQLDTLTAADIEFSPPTVFGSGFFTLAKNPHGLGNGNFPLET
jgi:serralysin